MVGPDFTVRLELGDSLVLEGVAARPDAHVEIAIHADQDVAVLDVILRVGFFDILFFPRARLPLFTFSLSRNACVSHVPARGCSAEVSSFFPAAAASTRVEMNASIDAAVTPSETS